MQARCIYRSFLFVRIAAAILCSFAGLAVSAQQYEPVLSDLEGRPLRQALARDYAPTGELFYGVARDTLYRYVWNVDGMITAQYSGYTVPMPDDVDPTDYLFSKGINTEHVYPQSKGSKYGNGRADMHHLYPAREQVNSDRSSLPFAEIDDWKTDYWYYKSTITSRRPSSNIDAYSEGSEYAFEPREAIKGDVARAVFYVWTIYRENAQASDPRFFERQRATLCDWHLQDPVDAAEYRRSKTIRKYQGNDNPFILDCSLPKRLGYCPESGAVCDRLVPVHDWATTNQEVKVYPNPAQNFVLVETDLPVRQWTLYNMLGAAVQTWPGAQRVLQFEQPLAAGIYVLRDDSGRIRSRLVVE